MKYALQLPHKYSILSRTHTHHIQRKWLSVLGSECRNKSIPILAQFFYIFTRETPKNITKLQSIYHILVEPNTEFHPLKMSLFQFSCTECGENLAEPQATAQKWIYAVEMKNTIC